MAKSMGKSLHTLKQLEFKQEILRIIYCTKTNSSGWVEYTKAQGRIPLKELGKMAPYVRNKEFLLQNKRINKERRWTVYQKHNF